MDWNSRTPRSRGGVNDKRNDREGICFFGLYGNFGLFPRMGGCWLVFGMFASCFIFQCRALVKHSD